MKQFRVGIGLTRIDITALQNIPVKTVNIDNYMHWGTIVPPLPPVADPSPDIPQMTPEHVFENEYYEYMFYVWDVELQVYVYQEYLEPLPIWIEQDIEPLLLELAA